MIQNQKSSPLTILDGPGPGRFPKLYFRKLHRFRSDICRLMNRTTVPGQIKISRKHHNRQFYTAHLHIYQALNIEHRTIYIQ